jgi:hypothetical protein
MIASLASITRRQAVLVALVAAGILASGCTATVHGHAVAADNKGPVVPPVVAIADLDNLLLPSVQVSELAKTPDMQIERTSTNMITGDEKYLSDLQCLDAWAPLEQDVYDGSGWTAVRGQTLKGGSGDDQRSVTQAVVAFPKAAVAQDFFDASQQRWSACANQSVTYKKPGKERVWNNGDIASAGGVISMVSTAEGGNGWECQRAMGVRSNVVIDVIACGYGVEDASGAIANKINAQVGES